MANSARMVVRLERRGRAAQHPGPGDRCGRERAARRPGVESAGLREQRRRGFKRRRALTRWHKGAEPAGEGKPAFRTWFVGLAHTVKVSPRLTSLAPQPRHRTQNCARFPWSEGFDCIFRNEGATGSNPVSSTNPWSEQFSGRQPARWIDDPEGLRSTGGPQDSGPKHLISCEVLSHSVLHQSTSTRCLCAVPLGLKERVSPSQLTTRSNGAVEAPRT